MDNDQKSIILYAFIASLLSLLVSLISNPVFFLDDPLKLILVKKYNIITIFSERIAGFPYRPFNMLVYELLYTILGTSFWAYHLVNLVFLFFTCIVFELIISNIYNFKSYNGIPSFLLAFSFILIENYYRLGTPDRITLLATFLAIYAWYRLTYDPISRMKSIWMGSLAFISLIVAFYSNKTALMLFPITFFIFLGEFLEFPISKESILSKFGSISEADKKSIIQTSVFLLVALGVMVSNQLVVSYIGESDYLDGYQLSNLFTGIFYFSSMLVNGFPVLLFSIPFLTTRRLVQNIRDRVIPREYFVEYTWLALSIGGIIGVSPWTVYNSRHLTFAVGCVIIYLFLAVKNTLQDINETYFLDMYKSLVKLLLLIFAVLLGALYFFPRILQIIWIITFSLALTWIVIKTFQGYNSKKLVKFNSILIIFILSLNSVYMVSQSMTTSIEWKVENQSWAESRDYLVERIKSDQNPVYFVIPYWYQLEIPNNFEHYLRILDIEYPDVGYFTSSKFDIDISNTTQSLPEDSLIIVYSETNDGIELFSSKNDDDYTRAFQIFQTVYSNQSFELVKEFTSQTEVIDFSFIKFIKSLVTLKFTLSDFLYTGSIIETWKIYSVN